MKSGVHTDSASLLGRKSPPNQKRTYTEADLGDEGSGALAPASVAVLSLLECAENQSRRLAPLSTSNAARLRSRRSRT